MNFKKMVVCVLALASLMLISACNTVEGMGKDLKHVGQSVESAAAKKTGD